MAEPGRLAEVPDSEFREAVERLVRSHEPERISLFGSAARCDTDGDSDSDGDPAEYRCSRLTYAASRGTGAAADIDVAANSPLAEAAAFHCQEPAGETRRATKWS